MPPRSSTWLVDGLVGFFTAAGSVLLGAPVGLLWSALAPHAHVDISDGSATISDGATEVFVAADGWFLGLTIAIGLASGVVAWLAVRGSGPYVVVGLAVGGLLAGLVASKVGMRIGQDDLRAAASSGTAGSYVANVALQAKQLVLAWPIAALAAFVTLVLSRPDEIV
jgi:hypothetical protein